MASDASQNDFSHLQDVLGNLPMLKRYIVICLCFPETAPPISEIEDALTDALTKLAKAFPFLAGQVIIEGRHEDSNCTGIAKIAPLRERIQLVTNDLTREVDFPSMAEMRRAKYPFSMLDADVLAPPIAVSWSKEGFEKVAPVLLLQANFVRGGMVLTVAGNHHTMDMTGLGMIIALFSKACRGEEFTDEEIVQGNQSRRNAVPLLREDYQPGPEIDDSLMKADGLPTHTSPASLPPRWAYFNFSGGSLSRLKEEAGQQTIVPYISTDDAVGALCWQRVARAREARLGSQTKTHLCRVLSVRKYLGLKGYLGHMVDCTYEEEVDVWERPLGEIAGRLRRLLQHDAKIKHHIQAFATILDRLRDKSKMVNGLLLDPHRDLVLSSYANIRCCELSFGPLLGLPEAARRPRMSPWPSLLYLMPKSKDGSIAVAFCMGEDDMARLREDEVLSSYAEYVG